MPRLFSNGVGIGDETTPAEASPSRVRSTVRWLLLGRLGTGAQVGLICLLLGLFASLTNGASGVSQATIWLIFGLFAISVDSMWGYCGLLSFGQAAFFGLGAYCYSWFTTDTIHANLHGAGSVVGLVASILGPAALALLLGYFLFYGRVVGAFFTIVTLALSFLMQSLGQGLSTVFGGYTGLPSVPGISVRLGSLKLSIDTALGGFILVAIITVIVAVLVRTLLKTRFGLGVDGVRDNEERLIYLGLKTVQIKLIVFVVASAIAGLAGALYASQANFVSSNLMGTLLSTEAVVWVAVGGRKTLVGALFGALVVQGVGFWLSGIAVSYWEMFLGVLFIALVLAGSTGLVGLGKWMWERGGRVATGNR